MIKCNHKEVCTMKKFFSLALTFAILVVSIFSVNAFAASPTKTEALLDKMNTAKEVSVTIRTGKSGVYGSDYGVANTIYVKDKELAYDLNNGFVTMRAVMTDGKIVGFLPKIPFFYLKIASPFVAGDGMWSAIKGISDITMGILYHVGNGTETVDGTEYYVEEFNDREYVTSKFYYVGDELKMLRVEDVSKKTVQYTYFDNISFEVDDSVFDTPIFAIDLTPILMLFFSSLLGTLLPA